MAKPSRSDAYKQLKKLPWTAVPATSAVSTGHGRRARRTIKAVLVPAWTGFAGAAQVAQVRRTVTPPTATTPAARSAKAASDCVSGLAVSLAAGPPL